MSSLSITVTYSAGSLVIQSPVSKTIQLSTPGSPQVIQIGSLSAAAQAQIGSIQASYDAIANGTAPSAGAITGSEIISVSRGSGILGATPSALKLFYDSEYLGYDSTRKQNYVSFPNSIEVGRKMKYSVGRQGSGCDVICTGVNDDILINQALLFCHNKSNFTGWTLEFSDEIFNLGSPLIRQAYVSMIGQGSRTTQFAAMPGLLAKAQTLATASGLPAGTGLGLQVLAPGAIQHLDDADYRMTAGAVGAPNNPGLFAFSFVAQPLVSQGNAGGLWYSDFRKIECDFFDNGIQSIGDLSANALLPNQFVNFKKVNTNIENTTGYAVDMRGDHGQIDFASCTLQRRNSSLRAGVNVRLGVNTDTTYPGNVTFREKCTFQNAYSGIQVYGAKGVNIIDCWGENLAQFAKYDQGATGSVLRNHLSNAGSVGDSNGYLLYIGNACFVDYRGNDILGNYDTDVVASLPLGYRASDNHILSQPIVTRTTGLTVQRTVSSSTLSTAADRLTMLNASATAIANITSDLLTGEEVTHCVLVNGGQTSQQYLNTGNIDLGGRASPLTVPAGVNITFVITDIVTRRFRLKCLSTG